MRRLLILTAAIWVYVWWCAPAHSQPNIFHGARPLTLVDRGLKKDDTASAVVIANTDAIQTGITEGGNIGYGVVLPVGTFHVNGLTVPSGLGARLEGGGGGGYYPDITSRVQTVLIYDDVSARTEYDTLDVSNLGTTPLKTPMIDLQAVGGRISNLMLFGATPDVGLGLSGPVADCLVAVRPDPVGANGKHVFDQCYFRDCNIAIYFGELDGTQADNADHCDFRHCRWDACAAAIVLNNEQSRQMYLYSPTFRSVRRWVDIYDGGVVTIDNGSLINTGGTVFHYRPESITGSLANNPYTARNLLVDAVIDNPTFPFMLVDHDEGDTSNHHHQFVFENLTLNGEPDTRMGIDKSGGPCFRLMGAQKLKINGATGCYQGMIYAEASTNIPQVSLADADLHRFQTDTVNSRRVGPQFVVAPGSSCLLNVSGYGFLSTPALIGATDITAFNPPPARFSAVYESVDDDSGYQREEYDDDVVYRFGERVDDPDTTVITGQDRGSWTVTAEFDGWSIVSFYARTVHPGAGGTMSMSVDIDDGVSPVELFTEDPTIDSGDHSTARANLDYTINESNNTLATGDVVNLDVDAVHSTTAAQGLTWYIELEPPP